MADRGQQQTPTAEGGPKRLIHGKPKRKFKRRVKNHSLCREKCDYNLLLTKVSPNYKL